MSESITEFPVLPLTDLYAANQYSKDAMTGAAVTQLVECLTEFGVSPADIVHHLSEAVKKVKEG